MRRKPKKFVMTVELDPRFRKNRIGRSTYRIVIDTPHGKKTVDPGYTLTGALNRAAEILKAHATLEGV